MTSKQIEKILITPAIQYNPRHVPTVLWEIALQIALFNEHQARMEKRYMEMTAPAVKNKSAVGRKHSAEGGLK